MAKAKGFSVSHIESAVRRIIAEQLLGSEQEIVNLKDSDQIIDDLGADSLDIVEMVIAFEEEFDIEIPDEKVEGRLSGQCTVVSVIADFKKELL